ncbi:GNAT family N-acetyltransferase [Fulvimarina sp. 2208YS6-2-32]|uniref:GNAT family N-acetyltransferase n=2 Tax=Fulvimarina uroteuthidis TaxID=3098149 RepID=A0ABU5HXJ1_9HYPH|nr:GNAT family N-acetyltransferase [Fulvimarina sp. 2208YS6-2-32]MDY8107851.1 GNAT family N-acetyltransferase [Fulvimarina sp. 2208YS6-2-32]
MNGLVQRGDIVATPLVDAELDASAELHAEAFSQAWSGDELGSLLAQSTTFGFAARRVGAPGQPPLGFVLARLVEGEAEILTIAVSTEARGRGVGRLLMDTVLAHLYAERADVIHLEVDEVNTAARALYRRLGFEEVGRRPAYYTHEDGTRTSALTLSRKLN